ncbi:MAG: BamA/OMP85 family outer membrane protein, partial [Planctomycetota bacterium]
KVFFRGNVTYPGDNPWFWFLGDETLLDNAEVKSQPAGVLTGSPYSVEIVEEDLESLRFFYRSRGFRDAEVELAGRRFYDDFSLVDLTFRVIEGPRYRIASIDLEQTPPAGQSTPLYSKDEILAELRTESGEFYDYTTIRRDNLAIEDFYGRRGHPPANRFGRNLQNAFEALEPLELIDFENHEIGLTFRIREGTPKILRDVKISGNRFTEDRVIRRKILVYPGEIIDIPRVQRSINSLDALRFFLDPEDFSGVRFELSQIAGEPDLVDLAVEVNEGDTGQFSWGAGISTGAGVQGQFRFIKRNFDITNLPSTWSPVGVIGEVASNEAFHGAGQELELVLAPGTELSLFQIRFTDPDIFRRHVDTIGLGVDAFRNIVFRDTYDADTLGAQVSLSRNFTEHTSVTVSFLQQTTDIDDIDPNAPTIVWDAEGNTEMRGPRIDIRYSDVDFPLQPSKGVDMRAYYEVIGGPFGGQTNFFTTGARVDYYHQLHRDSLDRAHVLYVHNRFDFGQAFRNDHDLYVNNRFYMGGNNLRGFDQRRAGPTQFDEPLGGEARYLAGAEYRFPLVSNRSQGGLREQEFLRGVVFSDFGLLGTRLNDSSFDEARLSVGFGLRISVPLLGVPIALDLAWPIRKEDTDEQRQFFFSLSR